MADPFSRSFSKESFTYSFTVFTRKLFQEGATLESHFAILSLLYIIPPWTEIISLIVVWARVHHSMEQVLFGNMEVWFFFCALWLVASLLWVILSPESVCSISYFCYQVTRERLFLPEVGGKGIKIRIKQGKTIWALIQDASSDQQSHNRADILIPIWCPFLLFHWFSVHRKKGCHFTSEISISN